MNQTVTVFKDIFSDKPFYTNIGDAIKRVKTGKSKVKVEAIRAELDEAKRTLLKKELPSFLFSGKFTTRADKSLVQHSGFVILDFDHCEPTEVKAELAEKPYIFAAWTSPSGEGVKALVKIKDPSLHRGHLKALFKELPKADQININTARVCFESWDPELYLNETAIVYETAIEKVDGFDQTKLMLGVPTSASGGELNVEKKFKKLQTWIVKQAGVFSQGNRNRFIYVLSGACSRFGIDKSDCISLISSQYLSKGGDFTQRELESAVESAYRAPGNPFGSAEFTKNSFVSSETKKAINIENLSGEAKPEDIVYGMDVAEDALGLYDKGYESAKTTYVPQLDRHFKLKRGELTVLSGIGNYGKSNWLEQILLIQSITDGLKWCLFAPESYPAGEFYHNLTETYLGCDCTPKNPSRPTRETYLEAYKKISQHFFFVYPHKTSPTPEYIRERFLEMVIKEKVDGCIIDPFNKLMNKWAERDDKYLEKFLSETIQWARDTNVYFFIICHPTKLKKDDKKNYPCPEVFDLANGAMWNNMADNILIYHRPNYQTDPEDTTCELHAKKIKRQKIVGFPGSITFNYNRASRRYYFDGFSPLDKSSQINPVTTPRKLVSEKKKKEESDSGEDLSLPFED